MTQAEGLFIFELYDKYHEKLRKHAYRRFGDVYLADDLVEETFLTAIVRVEKVQEHPSPERWLYCTMLHKYQHEYRRMARKREVPIINDEHPGLGREDVLGLIDLLPVGLVPRERDLLTWRYQDQIEYIEIARRLGISEEAARRRTSRALGKCRRLLFEGLTLESGEQS